MIVARALLILSMLVPSVEGFAQTDPGPPVEPGRALRPLRVGRTVLVDRKINMMTQLVIDEEGTAHMMSFYANGDHRSLRISRKGAVKQAIMYQGWPYIIDSKGRLWAMDISWKTILKTKIPVVFKRLGTKFPYAAGIGAGMAALGWMNIYLHAGTTGAEVYQPLGLGLAGFFVYYVTDAAIVILFKNPYKLQRGGNFFKTLIAKEVVSVEFDSALNDHWIKFRKPDDLDSRSYLSDVAPDYTKSTDCLYFLTRFINE